MIKCEVVFDEHEIKVNGFTISEANDGSLWFVYDYENIKIVNQFEMLEQAIKYCMEN